MTKNIKIDDSYLVGKNDIKWMDFPAEPYFNNSYEICNYGYVRNKISKNYPVIQKGPTGYYCVTLDVGNKNVPGTEILERYKKNFDIHTQVANAFIVPIPIKEGHKNIVKIIDKTNTLMDLKYTNLKRDYQPDYGNDKDKIDRLKITPIFTDINNNVVNDMINNNIINDEPNAEFRKAVVGKLIEIIDANNNNNNNAIVNVANNAIANNNVANNNVANNNAVKNKIIDNKTIIKNNKDKINNLYDNHEYYDEIKIINNINCKKLKKYNKYDIGNNGKIYDLSGKEIAPIDKNSKYIRYRLYNLGTTDDYSSHRLVALLFIPNPNNYPEVDHIDGNPKNNDVSNLRWCTHEQNMQFHVALNNIGTKVNQLDATTKQIINTFNTIKEAATAVGLKDGTSIGKCLKGIQKTAGTPIAYAWSKA